jgi:chaperonin GroES
MNIRPLYDRIVVKRIEEQETTRNGIIIPDSAKEKPQEGEVMAVGKGKRLDDGKMVALDVKAGDRILFGKYSGNEIKLDGTEYIIMREDDVLGVLDAPPKALQESQLIQIDSKGKHPWQNRLFIAIIPGRRSCAASTSSPTR